MRAAVAEGILTTAQPTARVAAASHVRCVAVRVVVIAAAEVCRAEQRCREDDPMLHRLLPTKYRVVPIRSARLAGAHHTATQTRTGYRLQFEGV